MARSRLPRWLPSPLKTAVFVLCLAPLAWLVWLGLHDGLGANPIQALERRLGVWALRFLLIALAVTPMRQFTGWRFPARLRRMLGLFAFFYVTLHLMSYVGLDEFFDWHAIGQDILKRTFITVGMAAFVMLIPLAVTSTDGMIRRLGGRRWRLLHRVVYVVTPLAILHYWMMIKAGHREPFLYGLIAALLLAWRGIKAMEARRARGAKIPIPAKPAPGS
jgi:sulfoxide reductase heme-binding subunit YedZ